MPDPAPTAVALAATHAAAFAGRERAWSVAEFADLLGQPGALLTGTAQSFVLGRVILDEAEVLTLATAPDSQRRGLARQALAAFEAAARAAGARHLFLEVAEPNHPARALYAAAGFAEAGRRKRYYTLPDGARVDALVLRKPLG